MQDCNGELDPNLVVPTVTEPVHSDLSAICPCVSPDGMPLFVAPGVEDPVTGGDYNLAFVS